MAKASKDQDDFDKRRAELRASIGVVVRNWADLESGLATMVAWFLGLDQPRSRILFASMVNFRARRELIIRLGETYLPDDALPKFRTLMRRLKHLGSKRNKLAHATILSVEDHFMFSEDTFDDDGSLMFRREEFKQKEVDDLSKAISALALDLALFGGENAERVLAFAKTHRVSPADPTRKTDLLYPATPVERRPPYQLVRL